MNPDEAEKLLADARRRIDAIDLQLRDLLNQRTQIVLEVLRAKEVLAMPVYEAKRENHVIDNVTAANPGPLDNDALRRLFESLMKEMRTFQQLRRGQ